MAGMELLNKIIYMLPTRERLSCMLNAKKVLPSPENFPRDWRGLCTLLNYTIPSGCDPIDPVGKIFKFCEHKVTIAYFIQCLERLDRYDVVDEIEEMIKNDVTAWKKKQFSVVNPVPVITHQENDSDIITLDDINRSTNGLPLTRYDAFLLYDDADIKSASEIVQRLEEIYNLKLCLKDRDLRPGIMFEYQAIIRLISDRCNWLITIVSNNFLKSPWNRFIINYTQVLAIEQRIPKIIPCVFDECILPQELKCYVHLFFNRSNHFCDPWARLRITISPSLLNNNISENVCDKSFKLNDSTKSHTKEIEQLDQLKISKDNVYVSSKKKNILGRFVHSVGSFSSKITQLKSNKNKNLKNKIQISST
ncbi:myeloid differentiation primary response protein MyD88 isoform X2 [Daktulosphaira vitifoliae]|uniref:myeloid differentiation primary response protein MyD88 isoform X2 n=1 Tax=Daktulosphaira vitifoliae TaxID=58002 RepID=UPI0021A991F8|nr:myeloid differentiation primary response protein MyD88 isoform X2 [Daktulosphaira vitifoliae]